MDWEQILFKGFLNLYDRWFAKDLTEEHARTIRLEEISSRLTLISRALTGENIEILPAEHEGGWKDHVFYLPATFALLPTLEENLNFYIFRTVILSIQFEHKINWKSTDLSRTLIESRQEAQKYAPQLLAILAEDYPAVASFYQSIQSCLAEENIDAYWVWGKFMVSQNVFDKRESNTPDQHTPQKDTVDPTTEIKSKPVEEVQVITVDKKKQEDYMLTHNFEKVETADEFRGIWRGFDGDDSLKKDEEALKELNLKHLVRTDEVAHSVYQADFRDLQNIAESAEIEEEEACLTYNEWDYAHKRYKINYCKVFLKKVKGGNLKYARTCLSEQAKTLNELRRKFAQINQKRRVVKKLPQGERIDIDALVDWYADIQSRKTPSENLYFSKRKKESDLAMLFLLDLSLSTNSYANGNRVLDVEKQAVILFGEVLSEYGVDFAVGGFYSKTRNHCAYVSLKDFGENWTNGKQKISAVKPAGYTRIGPALRHSKSLIEQHSSSNKWVILLSDGKPNDYDRYEGKYGIADVKQALREMHERHINTYAIAIESIARYYLPQMFGQNHYNILSHSNMLVQSLAMLYRRIQNK